MKSQQGHTLDISLLSLEATSSGSLWATELSLAHMVQLTATTSSIKLQPANVLILPFSGEIKQPNLLTSNHFKKCPSHIFILQLFKRSFRILLSW